MPTRLDPYEVAYDFIRALHHRLCQPLTALSCALEMAQMSCADDEKVMDQLQVANTQSALALELMGAFRLLFEAGSPGSGRHCTELQMVAKEVVADLAPLAEVQRVTCEMRVAEPSCVDLAPSLLHQAIWSVVQNSIETSCHGSKVEVRIEGHVVHVSDGAEPTEEEMANLLDPFSYCMNASNHARVSNLPLAIAQRIATACGGSMSVFLDDDRVGRRFELRFPSA